ncbi:hypothetical protein BDW75DRAFT_107953 [Aspergillus navahoensis]
MHQNYTEMRTYSRQSWIRKKWARQKAREVVEQQVSPRKQLLYVFIIAETWIFHECQESFLWRIPWLLSGNVYGLTDVLSTRSEADGISGEPETMGYGQIVPLVLLILPVFTAIQSIYGLLFFGRVPRPHQAPKRPETVPRTTINHDIRKHPGENASIYSGYYSSGQRW